VTADGDLGVGEVRDVGGALGEADPGADLAGGGRSTTGCPRWRKAGDADLRRARQSSICLGGDSGLTGRLLRVLRRGGTTATLGAAPGRGARRAEANERGGGMGNLLFFVLQGIRWCLCRAHVVVVA
jgi:hypothetical protein